MEPSDQPMPPSSSLQSIVTPIRAPRLLDYLTGYDSNQVHFLVSGFSKGFRIPFRGQRQFRFSKNLSSLKDKQHILLDRINEEILSGRVMGPFQYPPFKNIQVSPLGLVPKKKPGEFRLIHHLSYPDQSSINDGIPHELCTVQYQSIHDAILAIQKVGVGALLAKTDLENAYKQVPINPDDFELLGFQINNEFYCDKTLPFGLSYSCNLFEKFSSSLQWILENKFNVQYCVHILDDFLFVGPPNSPECAKALQSFRTLAQDINIPIQEEKTVSPTTVLTFLGIEIDTVKCEVRLPEDKLTSLKEVLSRFMCKRTATLQELQSLIGLLNFACAVVPRGRSFLRRIINLTRGIQKPHHHRNLDKESRADLKAWSIFIDKFNGRAFFPSGVEHTSHSLHLFTDASNLGYGGVFGTKWLYGTFAEHWLDYHISVR